MRLRFRVDSSTIAKCAVAPPEARWHHDAMLSPKAPVLCSVTRQDGAILAALVIGGFVCAERCAADFTGFAVESSSTQLAAAGGPIAADVHRVYAVLTDSGERVNGVGQWRPVLGAATFIHNDFVSGLAPTTANGTWSALLVPSAATLDSYLIVGGEPGLTSTGNALQDTAWGTAGLAQPQPPFAGLLTPGVGWVSQALPSNPAPQPDANGRVLVAQLVVPSGTAAVFRARVEWTPPGLPVRGASATFAIGPPIDLCPADPSKSLPLVCGCDASEADTDLDGLADCADEPASRIASLVWPPDETAYPRFIGAAMSLDGDRVALGAPETNVPGNLKGGFAIARRDDAGWTRGRFTPNTSIPDTTRFASAIALSDTTVAVGVSDAGDRGRVEVFRELRDGTWAASQSLAAPASAPEFANHGASVHLTAGDSLIVGMPGSGFAAFRGAVIVYAFDKDSIYSPVATIAEPTGRSARFGESIARDGDTLVVGAPLSSAPGSDFGAGAAFVYRRDGDGAWALDAELRAPLEFAFQEFGAAVAIDGDRILVGAPKGRFAASEAIGTAHVFTRDRRGAWSLAATLLPPDLLDPRAPLPARFGSSVALRGDRALVGAPMRTFGTPIPVGNAYLFEQDGSGAWPVRRALADRDPDTELFATTVALHPSGEILVGSPRTGPGISYFGALEVYADGAVAGDVNGDGFVNAADLTALLLAWGTSGGPADLDGDGAVNASDLALLLARWS